MGELYEDGTTGKGACTIECVTIRGLIQKERERLIEKKKSLLKDDMDWWDSNSRSDWVRRLFGANLTERSAENIFHSGNYHVACDVCSDKFILDEKILRIRSEDRFNVDLCFKCIEVAR